MAIQPRDVEPDYLPWSKYKHQAWRLLSGVTDEIPSTPDINNQDECVSYFAPLLEILIFGMDKDPLEAIEKFLIEHESGVVNSWQAKWWGPALYDIHAWLLRENDYLKSIYMIGSDYKPKLLARSGAYAECFSGGTDPFHLVSHSLDRRKELFLDKGFSTVALLTLPPRQLLGAHSLILEELNRRSILRTHNPPSGDYGEWLVAKHFNGKLLSKSAKGVDVETTDGKLIQVKARTVDVTSHKASPSSAIRDWDFTDMVLILFNRLDYSILEAYLAKMEVIKKDLVSYAKHDNKHFIPNISALKNCENVLDITSDLQATQERGE